MKASQLLSAIQRIIDEHGDIPVLASIGDRGRGMCFETHRHEPVPLLISNIRCNVLDYNNPAPDCQFSGSVPVLEVEVDYKEDGWGPTT